MTDLIQCARGKLDDPFVVEWAIHRYEYTKDHSPELAQEMALEWFDDLTLRRLIGSDEHDLLTSLFHRMPTERFSNVRASLVEQWPRWSSSLAYQSAPPLVAHDPERAVRLFTDHLSTNFDDPNKTLAVIKHLPDLPAVYGQQLLEKITNTVLAHGKDEFTKNLYLTGLLPVTIKLNPEAVEPVLSGLLKTRDDNDRFGGLLGTLSYALFDSKDFFELGTLIRKGKSPQTFQSLHPLFVDGAPLAECDTVLKSSKLLPNAMRLLDQHQDHSPATKIAHTLTQHLQSSVARSKHPDLGCLVVASVLHVHEREELDTTTITFEEAVDLLSVDLPDHRRAKTLADYLRTKETSEVVAAIEKRMPEVKDNYGGIHLAWVAGELGLVDLIPMLIDCMNKESGDYICEAAQRALTKLENGPRAVIDGWPDLDYSQQIYGSSVIQDVGGLQATDFAVQKFDSLFHEELERWCELALAAPDQQLIELLEPELCRGQRLIDRAFYVLCVLTDYNYENLDVVHTRIVEEHRRRQEHREAFESGKLLQETLSLQLRCPLCGDENSYDVRRVLLSEKPTEIPHILVDEFACASCDAWPEFEYTGEATMALTAELLTLQTDDDGGCGQHGSPVRLLNISYRWEERPAPDVMAELQTAVTQNPDSERDWVVLGRVNYLLGRPRRARECWQRVYDKDPVVMEAGLGVAQVMADTGATEPAFKLLTELLNRKGQWRFLRIDELSPAMLGREFAEIYNSLHKRLGIKDRPVLHTSFMGKRRKVGRNDPCPCGSGKKYKRCCLNG